jgi:hypothetical protein
MCSKMNGTGGHYFIINKPDSDGEVLHILYHILMLKNLHLEENKFLNC